MECSLFNPVIVTIVILQFNLMRVIALRFEDNTGNFAHCQPRIALLSPENTTPLTIACVLSLTWDSADQYCHLWTCDPTHLTWTFPYPTGTAWVVLLMTPLAVISKVSSENFISFVCFRFSDLFWLRKVLQDKNLVLDWSSNLKFSHNLTGWRFRH